MAESRGSRAMFTFLGLWVRPLMNALMAKEWRGQEKLPENTGMIVCPNHVTEIDPVVVGHFLFNQGVMPHFLAKASVFEVPVIGWMLRVIKQVPVERSSAGAIRSLEAAREALADGGGIIIYPEGTLTRDPDMWPMKGRTGAARLALQTGAPVVPLAHWGAQDVFPRYATRFHLFPRKRVRVLVGEPVDLSDFQGVPLTRASLDAATDRILDAITALVAELRGQTPPAIRWDPARKPSAGAEPAAGQESGERALLPPVGADLAAAPLPTADPPPATPGIEQTAGRDDDGEPGTPGRGAGS